MRAAPRAGQSLAKRYTLTRELGRGGMGAVWEARDEKLGRQVAVKMLIRALMDDDSAMARFDREAKAVANLHSPHIVELHDYGVDRGSAFMVMELLRGDDLAQRLKARGTLPLSELAHIIKQVSKALATAHEAGIVHRDLKPGNIFLVRDQEDEYVKVFDFGVAKAFRTTAAKSLTIQGALVGTPRYMSPEQVSARPSDPRDDVWALAVIAYRALVGVHAFQGLGVAQIVELILTTTPEPPTSCNPTLPTEVDLLFAKAFADDREQRFQSARELARAFTGLAEVSSSFSGIDRSQQSLEPPVTQRMTSDPTPSSSASQPIPPLPAPGDPADPGEPADAPTRQFLRSAPGDDMVSVTGPLAMATPAAARRKLPFAWLTALSVLSFVVAVSVAWLATPAGDEPTAGAASAASPANVSAVVDIEPSAPSTLPAESHAGEVETPVSTATASAAASAAETPPPATPPTSPIATTTTWVRPPYRPPTAPPAATSPPAKGDDLFDKVY